MNYVKKAQTTNKQIQQKKKVLPSSHLQVQFRRESDVKEYNNNKKTEKNGKKL